jgi:hypothetical protein
MSVGKILPQHSSYNHTRTYFKYFRILMAMTTNTTPQHFVSNWLSGRNRRSHSSTPIASLGALTAPEFEAATKPHLHTRSKSNREKLLRLITSFIRYRVWDFSKSIPSSCNFVSFKFCDKIIKKENVFNFARRAEKFAEFGAVRGNSFNKEYSRLYRTNSVICTDRLQCGRLMNENTKWYIQDLITLSCSTKALRVYLSAIYTGYNGRKKKTNIFF